MNTVYIYKYINQINIYLIPFSTKPSLFQQKNFFKIIVLTEKLFSCVGYPI